MAKDLQPVPINAIEVGKPLPWTIYDRNGHLMAKEGQLVTSNIQKEALQQRGMYRNRLWMPHHEQHTFSRLRIEPEIGLSDDLIDDRAPRSAASNFETPDKKLSGGGNNTREVAYRSLRFSIGTTLQLRGIDNNTLSVRLIGHNESAAIFTSAPTGSNGIIMLKEGQTYQFRGFLGRHICLFTTSVLKTPLTPFPHVLFEMPATATLITVRNANRLRLNLIGAVHQDKPDAEKSACSILDLSSSGALVASNQPLGATGDTLRLFFRLPAMGRDSYLKLSAIIRSERTPEDGDKPHHYGIEFSDASLQDKLILENFVLNRLADIQS